MSDTNGAVDSEQQHGDDDSEDGELMKRRCAWLASLPHEQIVHIILKLQQHIPDDVKTSVQIWPDDIESAPDKEKSPEAPQIVNTEEKTTVIATTTSAPLTVPVPIQPAPYPHAPYYPPNIPSAPLTPHLTPPPQPPPFHTPYSYYPHYPAYPPPPPGQPVPYPFYPAQPPPQNGSKPLFTSTPLAHPTDAQRNGDSRGGGSAMGRPKKEQVPEDLPSYEEMIVEGLSTIGGEDGMAPKALFAWISTRYPVQANFRPSASQALQKAYKRGRLEKSSTGGKYRLNPAWEGGSTRRGTRRPQTSAQAPVLLATPAPAVYPWPQPQYPMPYPPPVQSEPSQTAPLPPAATATANIPAAVDERDVESEEEGEGAVWEAAQNILQALDLSSLLPNAKTAKVTVEKPPASSTAVPGVASPTVANSQIQSGAVPTAPSDKQSSPEQNTRDTLQRSLALLAVQLADFAGNDGGIVLEFATTVRP